MQLTLCCRSLSKSYGDKAVLNKVNLDLCLGDRIGIVGRNGAGKSTLADILAGRIAADEGNLIIPKSLRIGYLRQNETDSSLFLSQLHQDPLNGETQQLYKQLGITRISTWSSLRKLNMSGGEKRKLAMSTIWASNPDLLILDEPTNHMDYQGVEWMVKELAGFDGILLIVSHDRYFLDRTVTGIAELDGGSLRHYPGNYTDYRRQKEKEREKQWHDYESDQKQQRKLEESIKQLQNWSEQAHRESRKKALDNGGGIGGKEYYRAKARKRDKAVKSKLIRLEKERRDSTERPRTDLKVSFDFIQAEKRGKRLLVAEGLGKSYPDLPLFASSSFYLNHGEKIGVFGPNGCGKTTLFRVILGEDPPDQGNFFLSSSARIAYVSQDFIEEAGTVLNLLEDQPRNEQKRVFNLLAGLGISYDRCQVALQDLSRGEHMKIKLGLALMGEYDLLMLDEPTNHLDLPSREALENSLVGYAGSILIISHDRYLLERVCDHMLVFENQQVSRVEGSLADYLNSKPEQQEVSAQTKAHQAEQILLLDMKITCLLNEIARCKPGDPEYQELNTEYQQLITQKRHLFSK